MGEDRTLLAGEHADGIVRQMSGLCQFSGSSGGTPGYDSILDVQIFCIAITTWESPFMS